MDTGNEPPVPADPHQAAEPPRRAPGEHDRTPARDGRNRFIGDINTDEKAANAARILADNPGMSYRELAAATGYTNPGSVWRAVQRCRQAVLAQAGAELIGSEAAQLDDLFVSAMEVLERDHLVVSHGKVITDTDGTPLLDDGPKLAAIREMRAIRESYRKLLGVDAAQKLNVDGSVRYEVVGVDGADLT